MRPTTASATPARRRSRSSRASSPARSRRCPRSSPPRPAGRSSGRNGRPPRRGAPTISPDPLVGSGIGVIGIALAGYLRGAVEPCSRPGSRSRSRGTSGPRDRARRAGGSRGADSPERRGSTPGRPCSRAGSRSRSSTASTWPPPATSPLPRSRCSAPVRGGGGAGVGGAVSVSGAMSATRRRSRVLLYPLADASVCTPKRPQRPQRLRRPDRPRSPPRR